MTLPKKPIRIPLSVPCLGPEEEQAVLECVKSGWVSSVSPAVKAFETEFAQSLGTQHAVATNAGTAALHMAMLALDIGPGDEVIVPALTFVATVNPVRYLGATPVFVDAESTTFGMNPAAVEAAITEKTKAIIVAHLYGFPARIRAIVKIANQYNLPVIEDAAEALGASVDGDFIGTIGTIGCFSFNGNKTITCGGGGMAITNDKALAAKMLHLSTQAREADNVFAPEISHDAVGYNCRMTGMQAALGRAQLKKMGQLLSKKRLIAKSYAQELASIPGIQIKYLTEPNKLVETDPSYWLSVGLVDDHPTRNHMIRRALDLGIEFRPFFKPIPLLKPYQDFAKGSYPVAEELWRRGLCLPSCPSMNDLQQQEVIAFLAEALDRKTKGLHQQQTSQSRIQTNIGARWP